MKKYIYSLIFLLAGVVFMTSCEKMEGTLPGNDTSAYATIGLSSPALPYDADCDVVVRIAANSAASAVYYFAEPTATKEARNLPEAEYGNFVKENGTKISDFTVNEFDGANVKDVVLQGLSGDNTITVVAENEKGQYVASTTFYGVKWDNICTGEYSFAIAAIASRAGSPVTTTLQRRSDQPNTYRFRNLFGAGKNLVFTALPDYKGEDGGGVYTFIRVEPQSTGLTYGSYGEISIRDVGYWQGDDGFVLEGGYEGGIYDATNEVFVCAQYYVSAGSLGYNYDSFIPAN